jgi:myb proto-oncogene protein
MLTVLELGDNWDVVAALVPGRTNEQCRARWVKRVDPSIKNDRWRVEEDAILTRAVKEHGSSSWPAVAAMVPGRTNGQCRKRWEVCESQTAEQILS